MGATAGGRFDRGGGAGRPAGGAAAAGGQRRQASATTPGCPGAGVTARGGRPGATAGGRRLPPGGCGTAGPRSLSAAPLLAFGDGCGRRAGLAATSVFIRACARARPSTRASRARKVSSREATLAQLASPEEANQGENGPDEDASPGGRRPGRLRLRIHPCLVCRFSRRSRPGRAGAVLRAASTPTRLDRPGH